MALRWCTRIVAALLCAAFGLTGLLALPQTAVAGETFTARADLRRSLPIQLFGPPTAFAALYAPPDAANKNLAHQLRRQVAIRQLKRETWSGAMVSDYGWSVYSGLTYALFGAKSVRDDGWRFRVANSVSWRGGLRDVISDPGKSSSLDLYLGYHKNLGWVTVKAFIGATTNGRTLYALYSGQDIPGSNRGTKVAIETWFNLSPDLWLSLDGSASSNRSSLSIASRLGYRLMPEFSAGPEIALYSDTFDHSRSLGGRLGGFVRYEWAYRRDFSLGRCHR